MRQRNKQKKKAGDVQNLEMNIFGLWPYMAWQSMPVSFFCFCFTFLSDIYLGEKFRFRIPDDRNLIAAH